LDRYISVSSVDNFIVDPLKYIYPFNRGSKIGYFANFRSSGGDGAQSDLFVLKGGGV